MMDDVGFLQSVLSYDEHSGILTWKKRDVTTIKSGRINSVGMWNKRYSGKQIVAAQPTGYISVVINGKRYMAHRLAWVIYHGKPIPKATQLDHINCNRSDNRIENLRLCTPHQNQANISRSGNGAQYRKSDGRWQASIRIHLGVFNTEDEASEAYEKASRELHGKFFRPNGKPATAARVL